MKKLTFFFITLAGYLWHFSLYIVIIPLVSLEIGKGLDELFLVHFLNSKSVLFLPILSSLIGFITAFLGVGFIIWATLTLQKTATFFPFTIVQMPYLNPKKLATLGPYDIVRHPMLLGYLLCLFSLAVFKGSIFTAFWVTPLWGAIFGEYLKFSEEKKLEKWFGEEYRTYGSKVPFLIPKISLEKIKKALR